MSDFITELEEDIREERLRKLWQQYGNYIIGLAVAIVIGTIAYTMWQYYKNKSQQEDSLSYSRAITLYEQGKKEEALVEFQVLANKRGGYSRLARLYEASLLSSPSNVYEGIILKNRSNPALSGLAKVLNAANDIRNKKALEELVPLTAPRNAWGPLSLELLAAAFLKAGNDVEAAKNYVHILKDRYASPTEQLRAQMMLSQIDVPASLLEGKGK